MKKVETRVTLKEKEHCENVQVEKEKQVKEILENWLNKRFGYGKKLWRAVKGRKKIHIHH